jgi:PAS domain S-box-containing protein
MPIDAIYTVALDQEALLKRYQRLVEAAGDVIYSADTRGRLTYINASVERLFGYAPSEMLGRRYLDYVHPDWVEHVAEFYLRQFMERIPETTYELELFTASGESRWVEQIVQLVLDDEDHVTGFIGFARDVTERKRQETATRDSEERFAKLAANTPAAVFITENFEIIYANNQLADLTGYNRGELMSVNPLDIVYPDDLNSLLNRTTIQHHDPLRPSLRQELRLLRKDGDIRWVDIAITPLELAGTSVSIGVALDVTERKRIQTALQDLNYRYYELVDNIPGLVFRVRVTPERQASFEYLSPRTEEMNGIPLKLLMANAQAALTLLHPEERAAFGERVLLSLNTTTPFFWEGRLVVRGAERWARLEARPHPDSNGDVIWHGLQTDVTTEKRAEEALRKSEERYRLLAEYTRDFVALFDVEKRSFSYLSPSLKRFFNFSDAEMLRYETDVVFQQSTTHPDDRVLMMEAFQEVVSTHRPVRTEYRVRDGNTGGYIWLESLITPIVSGDDQLRQILVTARDVTERREADIELHEYVHRMEIIQRLDAELTEELNFDYVLKIALDAAVRISQAQAGAIHLLEGDQLRVANVIGDYPHSMVGTCVTFGTGLVGRAARTTEPELILDVTQDPEYVANVPDMQAQMTLPLMSRDKLIGVLNVQTPEPERFTPQIFDFIKVLGSRIGSALDNAQLYTKTQQQLNELTKLYQQVSDLEQLKTQMIRIAAHDLRNPLGVISGYMQMLDMEIGPSLSDRSREHFGYIKESSDRIDKITRDILTLERISAGKDISREPINLTEMIKRAFEDARSQAIAKTQDYRLDLGKSKKPILVVGDRFMLPETVINLITNAIKYTPDGGKVLVQLRTEGDKAFFDVHDTGYGIPEEQQANLFQAFYRVKLKETRSIKGTGLGLHLVKNIIERHHGTMRFHSTYGKGSTFGFELPLNPQSKSRRKPATQ